eukprot:2041335-Alexandrium_andersonii.AAC.1
MALGAPLQPGVRRHEGGQPRTGAFGLGRVRRNWRLAGAGAGSPRPAPAAPAEARPGQRGRRPREGRGPPVPE